MKLNRTTFLEIYADVTDEIINEMCMHDLGHLIGLIADVVMEAQMELADCHYEDRDIELDKAIEYLLMAAKQIKKFNRKG